MTSIVFAHRGMPGAIQNTRKGLLAALEAGYPGIEFDLVLTKDGVPILSHDPWLHTEYVDGGGRDRLIRDMTWEEVKGHKVSGQEQMDLDEVLELAREHPGVALYLDVKIEPQSSGLTASAERYADAILGRLSTADLTNPVFIEAPSAEIATIYRERLAEGYSVYLSRPRYEASKNGTLQTLGELVAGVLGIRDPVAAVKAAGVDGYTAHHMVVTKGQLRAAQQAGIQVMLFGIGDAETAAKYHGAGRHLIVDHGPGLPG